MPTVRRRSGGRVDYRALAELRYQVRRFLRKREVAARAAGIEPQQYLLLLQVKGLEGQAPATIGALAERLQIHHHAAVQLVDRLARARMVARRAGPDDRRAVVVVLRRPGATMLERLARASVAELEREAPVLVDSLRRLVTKPPKSQRGQP
jgi:DNA-binding MarR family transcriptional regulator